MSVEAQPTLPMKLLQFYSEKQFQDYTDEYATRCIVTYKREVFDVTEFLDDHPGGDQIVRDCNGRDISDLFHSNYPHAHSKSALRMLMTHKIGELKYQEENSSTDADSNDEVYPVVSERWLQYRDFRFDRQKGMVIQTLNLNKEQYLDFIHHPLHLDNTFLFEWKFFEFFTRNKWYYIPMVWIPISIAIVWYAINTDFGDAASYYDKYLLLDNPSFTVFGPILAFLFGTFLWTLAEYLLHRFLFHLDDHLLYFKAFRFVHFLVHGIHHVIPMDSERLVFPPPMAAVIAMPIITLYYNIFGGSFSALVFAGTLSTYVAYDYFHWWLHHGKGGLEYFKDLKRYHNLHHYFDENNGYGITSKFWDIIFGTTIKIKDPKATK